MVSEKTEDGKARVYNLIKHQDGRHDAGHVDRKQRR